MLIGPVKRLFFSKALHVQACEPSFDFWDLCKDDKRDMAKCYPLTSACSLQYADIFIAHKHKKLNINVFLAYCSFL